MGTYLQRYTNGEWRAHIFRDMILADARVLEQGRGKLSILDIGCGAGFDGDAKLQHSISKVAGRFIGVEPDVRLNQKVAIYQHGGGDLFEAI